MSAVWISQWVLLTQWLPPRERAVSNHRASATMRGGKEVFKSADIRVRMDG